MTPPKVTQPAARSGPLDALFWRHYETHHLCFFTVLVGSGALYADTVEVPWAKVCEASHGQRLVLTTNDRRDPGRILHVDRRDEIALTKDQRVVRVAKSAVSHLHIRRLKGHQLAALWKGVGHEMQDGADLLFSPLAPVGAVMVPGSLAWGAVATPFCILADIGNFLAGEDEIKVK